MPGTLISDAPFSTTTCKPLHPSLSAEVLGADFNNMSEKQFQESKGAIAKYIVLIFRKANFTNEEHIAFSRGIGKLEDYTNVSNISGEGQLIEPESSRAKFSKGNNVFYNNGAFNWQRASWSILRSVQLPPLGTRGETEYADNEDLKNKLLKRDLVSCHSFLHLRKLGAPEYFKDLDPWSTPFTRFRLVSTHEPSGRNTLYTRDGKPLPEEENRILMKKLIEHVTRPENVLSVDWHNNGDLIAWDNVSTLHRATGGIFEGKYFRDMRRTTVKDDSADAWGLNSHQELEGQDLAGLGWNQQSKE
ncbi:uncharacterized protein SETTUDRAFT_161605 [Exserohilum turcica Et28A]|uniref:TauD/TfdA-like domain-containing protein n=1 Tax=Exserohilum turcicum (strain 28A) TaxID=671987 RepID=R0JY64_EXST2|nr:uncharacterized protein SETTUDRAFT_161605 [Exserohilum turcica Et28A]EOA85858.1 hypothetical protein SETTUDRAFT_161605 [Exserohilum turcica Et28A]